MNTGTQEHTHIKNRRPLLNNTIPILIICSFIIMLSSCNSYKKLTYLQNIAETRTDSLFEKNKPGYRIQPGDMLYIRIITTNDQINQMFNPLFGSQSNMNFSNAGGLYFITYSVTDSGYIRLPVLDTVYVVGLNLEEVHDCIALKAKKYLYDAQVIVKLANFRFTVLGEVRNPGVKQMLANQVNVMEALAFAGDITYNGNRDNILLIRATKNGSQTFRIDVTDYSLISSELYYIMPNDIIYVEPLKTTLFRERTSDYLVYLSTFTSILTALFLILNLTR